jgi:hypothetical protein
MMRCLRIFPPSMHRYHPRSFLRPTNTDLVLLGAEERAEVVGGQDHGAKREVGPQPPQDLVDVGATQPVARQIQRPPPESREGMVCLT